ncbi:MAG: sporulation protein YabP [Ruminococcaceae bacterium]|nr:sporulation protein YabP [Oscillospiraceae bacterium]
MSYELNGVHHSLSLSDRGVLTLSGIKEVIGFDEQTVCVMTHIGQLVIEGQSLHIDKLNVESGDLIVTGEISSLAYTDGVGEKKGFIRRLLG